MSHADRDATGSYGYEQLVQAVRQLALGQAAVTPVFRRAVFKFGFLMDRSGSWKLAPAFDITYSYDPTGRWPLTHQLRLGGKQDDFTYEDLLSFGRFCNLRNAEVRRIVTETIAGLASFPQRALALGVPPALVEQISTNLRLDLRPTG